MSKYFETLCTFLGVEHFRITAYIPQTNGQVDPVYKTIVTRLCHYVPTHQRDWDLFIQPLMYLCSTQALRTTRMTPFSLWINSAKNLPPPTESMKAEIRHSTDQGDKASQEHYKRHHDAQMREQTSIYVGQLVYVHYPPLSAPAADKMTVEANFKLRPHALGPYRATSTTLLAITIDQNRILNTIYAD